MDKHKINELTDSIVDDLIKNAFKKRILMSSWN